jgi:AcrR family transcriptional regulator
VLDAAEKLLLKDGTAFSMRDLAKEAGLSFATPFNHFGNKAAIMRALSARRIALMRERLAHVKDSEDAVSHVRAAVEIATTVMLASPTVNRAIIAGIGSQLDDTSDVLKDSTLLWSEAIGAGVGLHAPTLSLALALLPVLLAISFRGALSFWTAGEIEDIALTSIAQEAAAVTLLGFVEPRTRKDLLEQVRQNRQSQSLRYLPSGHSVDGHPTTRP